MGKYEWLFYVILAGLAWGTYVPIIFYGGGQLTVTPEKGPPTPSGRVMAILCVGGAYFVIGVLLPLIMFATGWLGVKWSDVNFTAPALTFASLAGVAGAVGAICVVFATSSAIYAGKQLTPPNPNAYRVLIAPLIFGLAPVINVLVATIWHPEHGWKTFGIEKVPHPLLWVGVVLVGVGAGLVLYSKELTEASQTPPKTPASLSSPALGGAVGLPSHQIETRGASPEHKTEPKP